MGTVLSVVPPLVSVETVRKIAKLHAAALRGDVIGIAYMIEHPENHYTVDIAGEASRDLPRTRGRLLELDDELAKLSPRK